MYSFNIAVYSSNLLATANGRAQGAKAPPFDFRQSGRVVEHLGFGDPWTYYVARAIFASNHLVGVFCEMQPAMFRAVNDKYGVGNFGLRSPIGILKSAADYYFYHYCYEEEHPFGSVGYPYCLIVQPAVLQGIMKDVEESLESKGRSRAKDGSLSDRL